ncbi:DUF296 domain-containing protein [bacterium]|nr:DUF296 domain-containing protein [bacterium]
MQIKQESSTYAIRFERGENFFETLKDWVKRDRIHGAAILGGVGMFENPKLGYFTGADGKYVFTVFEGCFECLSLQGNIAWRDDEPIIHCHAVLGREDFTIFGGHLADANVAVTIEMFVRTIDPSAIRMQRKLEPNGLAGLYIE